MRSVLILISLGACLLSMACSKKVLGSGVVTMDERDLEPFSKIDISGLPMVEISFGVQQQLSIIADDNLISYLFTKVEDSTLHISFEKKAKIYENVQLKILIEVPTLKHVSYDGANNLKITGFSDLPFLSLDHTGIGSVYMAGSATEFALRHDGVGQFSGFDFSVDRCVVQQLGIADVELKATKNLLGEIKGTGDVLYRGNPKVEIATTGVGRVINAN